MHFKIMLLTTFINASEFIRKKLFCQNFKNYQFTALSCPFEDWLMQCKHFYYCNKSYCLVTIILTQDALKNVCINTLFSILSSKTPPYKLIISIKTAWQKTSCGCCRFLCICPGKMAVIDVNTSSWWQFNHLQASKYVFINDRLINFHIYSPSTDKAVAYEKF